MLASLASCLLAHECEQRGRVKHQHTGRYPGVLRWKTSPPSYSKGSPMSANFNTSESGSINFIYDDDEQIDGKKVREAYLKRQLERPNKIHEALKYLVEPGTVTELRPSRCG